MPSTFESEKLKKTSKPFLGIAQQLGHIVPNLEWNLTRAGIHVEPLTYVSITVYMAFLSWFSNICWDTPASLSGGQSRHRSPNWLLTASIGLSILHALLHVGYAQSQDQEKVCLN